MKQANANEIANLLTPLGYWYIRMNGAALSRPKTIEVTKSSPTTSSSTRTATTPS